MLRYIFVIIRHGKTEPPKLCPKSGTYISREIFEMRLTQSPIMTNRNGGKKRICPFGGRIRKDVFIQQ